MSKGNGRKNKNNMGNGMDKFRGSCNGISSETQSPDPLDFDTLKQTAESDIISGNINRSNKGKGYKSKLK
ncbi:hypothetical protein [Sedimentibacter sp. MB31-C6]|uniref:hypothetical protein n=1 Tax=Sedimentibacter sp. MB31-C6 TaxID=3109366 RepID=UPI002DDCED42|nr:hypothetical protein [Sedimentibacter sp. MB36-C1]WSI04774.1 hypothetical protein U8307_03030 [Sedimentibacter sp. MB36-C1]